ncbi:MAG: VOC family protein [Minwuia sp.]|uniref:VOC family protein n=1 Tax=Minwuia sp. TaxID=2493630 RepID=UPI003A8B5899
MSNGIRGIDHLVVAVQDLERARETWTALGFTCTPRGRHRNLATGNYCIMFPDDYVELIGIVDPSLPDRGLIGRMKDGGEGLDRIAFAVADIDATAGALSAAGFGVRGPIDLHRPLELPEGDVEPRFRLLHFEDPAVSTPGLHGFFCYHVTPEITRGEPAWLSHANGVERVLSVTAVAENPEALAEDWQRLMGPGSTVLTDNTLTVHSGNHAIIFVTPDHLAVMFPAHGEDADRPAPYVAAATFRSADLEATSRWLTDNGVPHGRDREGGVQVGPAHANGCIIAFE